MTWTEARAGALDVVRVAYRQEVARVAEELAPTWKGSHFREENDETLEPLKRFEDACRAAMVVTEDDARAVFAASEHWRDHVEDFDPRVGAGTCVALDVAHLLEMGWYIDSWREPTEEETAAVWAREGASAVVDHA
jgi:hypothetical protein